MRGRQFPYRVLRVRDSSKERALRAIIARHYRLKRNIKYNRIIYKLIISNSLIHHIFICNVSLKTSLLASYSLS